MEASSHPKPRPRHRAVGMACSACFTSDAPVYSAALVDEDGTYYPLLCDECFDTIESTLHARQRAAFKQQVADSLVELMPSEIADGVVSELEDAEARGLFG